MGKTDHLYIKPTNGVEWGAPKTVRQLIAQLETMDPNIPVHAVLFIDLDGKRRARAKHLSMSFERIDGPWIKERDESVPYSLVFWTSDDERHISQPVSDSKAALADAHSKSDPHPKPDKEG